MNVRAILRQPAAVPNTQHCGNGIFYRTVTWFRQWGSKLLILLLLLALADTINSGAEQGEVISGVLESVSLESSTVRIRSPLGQPIILKIKKSHLLGHVTVGDRVTVVVNESHEIIKLIETPIPELPPPSRQ